MLMPRVRHLIKSPAAVFMYIVIAFIVENMPWVAVVSFRTLSLG